MSKKRENWDVKIECPNCGREGRLQGSEAQNPVEEPLNERLEGVSPGFSIVGRKVICDGCGSEIRT